MDAKMLCRILNTMERTSRINTEINEITHELKNIGTTLINEETRRRVQWTEKEGWHVVEGVDLFEIGQMLCKEDQKRLTE